MLVFRKFAFDFDLEFFYVSITPGKLIYLYQKLESIAISEWFHPMEKGVIMR